MKTVAPLLMLALVATAPAAAATTTVYRCGQTYQQMPCKDGQTLAVNDARDPAQRQAAQQAAAAVQRTADGLAAERAQREQSLQPVARPARAKSTPATAAPAVATVQKHPRSKYGKHPKTLEANDRTLYSARNDKKPDTEARMPAP